MVKADPAVYFAAAKQCHRLATDLHAAREPLYHNLGQCGGMAGQYDSAEKWATGCDDQTTRVAKTAEAQIKALRKFGDVLNAAGYNWAQANWQADRNPNKGPAPVRPPTATAGVCFGQLPSVKGDNGSGLNTNISGLLNQIGVPVPDGDTNKLTRAAQAWTAFAGHSTVKTADAELNKIAGTFTALNAPDVQFISEHFATLRKGAADIALVSSQMAAPITAHQTSLAQMRGQINGETSSLITKLGLAVGATIVVAAIVCVATAGISAAGGAAAAGATATELIAATAITIRGIITASSLLALLGMATATFVAKDPGVAVEPALNAIAALVIATDEAGATTVNANNKPPADAYDPHGSKAPGKPGAAEGFQPPKGGDQWVESPTRRGKGWLDKNGDVWVPTGQGSDAHGGPHWDVQQKSGGYRNVMPGGKVR